MNKSSGIRVLALAALLFAASGPMLVARPQMGRSGSSQTPPPGVPTAGQLSPQPASGDAAQVIYVRHMIDFQLIKRFKQVQQDTGKLLELSRQLEDSTAKATAANSSDAQHQAAQIEKLAKSINQNTRD
jgi:hypothetical protein